LQFDSSVPYAKGRTPFSLSSNVKTTSPKTTIPPCKARLEACLGLQPEIHVSEPGLERGLLEHAASWGMNRLAGIVKT
jgi:hypothetical protein